MCYVFLFYNNNNDNMRQWKGKALHGQFPHQVESLKTVECAYKRLSITGLKIETETLTCAAEDQAPSTNAAKFRTLNYPQDPSCRLCHSFPEKNISFVKCMSNADCNRVSQKIQFCCITGTQSFV